MGKLDDIDPQAWLANVLVRIADMPQNHLEELLPWNWAPPAMNSLIPVLWRPATTVVLNGCLRRYRLAGHRRWRLRSRAMAIALVVPWTWVREGKARSGAILHPLNLFRIASPLDYAVVEWLGSTSRAPNWLQQPFGITIAPVAQRFRDRLEQNKFSAQAYFF